MKRYKLIWSPEGRAIAEVLAKSPKAARRKAPMPYKKYPGEIIAEEILPPNFSEIDLDSMDVPELWEFNKQATLGIRPIRLARELFPERPKRYVRTTRDLGHYVANKAVARSQRLQGNINIAMQYESVAERIYKGLPDYAKW